MVRPILNCTFFSLLLIGQILLSNCSSDISQLEIIDKNYYPLRGGDFRIYQISETKITPYNVKADFEYQLKTVVSDSFLNVVGTYSYIISRYTRSKPSDNWKSLDTWTARFDSREVVINESNIPFVKISFPVLANRKWNGNAYNGLESSEFCEGNDFTSCDLYAFGEIKKPYSPSSGVVFENTIEIIENNRVELIEKYDVRKSIYALHVGMVYHETTLLKYCTTGTCTGKQMVEDGLVYKQRLLEYGHQ